MTQYERVLQLSSQLELPEQLRLLEALSRQVRRQVEGSGAHSIMELEGLLGADIWQGMDAQEYVNQERASWDSARQTPFSWQRPFMPEPPTS